MWLLAFAIFAACKGLTWWTTATTGVSLARQLGYLIAWPGLDAKAFFHSATLLRPTGRDWLFAGIKLAIGVALTVLAYPRLHSEHELMRGWIGMLGIIFVLHFGIFHLLSLAWQAVGVNARPI